MKKVFASDFDGTLYFYKAEVKLPPENVEKIREYQAAGHLFGLCTGRQVGGLTPFIKGYVEPDFYITSSGANIVDKDLKEIRKAGVDRAAAAGIVAMADPEKRRITLDIEGTICVFQDISKEEGFPGNFCLMKTLDDAPEGLIHQVSVHTESEGEAQEIADLVNKTFGDYVNAFRNVVEVDIAPAGCSKGAGVKLLRKYMEERYGKVKLYGIGDSMNDLPLIEAADVSYTFPYAPGELQKKASKVVPAIVDALEDSMRD